MLPGEIFDRTIHALFFQLFERLVARLQNQIGPCSKLFKIISRNLIQKRTEDINIHKEKQNNLITRFKTNTICKFFVVIIEGINKRHNPYPYMTCSRPVNYRGFQTRSAFCEFSEVVESFTAKKRMD